jgi:ribosomal protein S27E
MSSLVVVVMLQPPSSAAFLQVNHCTGAANEQIVFADLFLFSISCKKIKSNLQ